VISECWCVHVSFVKTYDEAQDSTLGVKKRKIEEVTEVGESKPKKAKLADPASGIWCDSILWFGF